jgi:hypothetical protein
MNLEKLRVAVNKLNLLLNDPVAASDFYQQVDVESEFNQQLDQLLAEFDAARNPPSQRFFRTSHRPSVR